VGDRLLKITISYNLLSAVRKLSVGTVQYPAKKSERDFIIYAKKPEKCKDSTNSTATNHKFFSRVPFMYLLLSD
jgi:hypothetical protein